MKNKFYKYLQLLQDNFTNEFEKIDTKAKFNEDIWIRPEGGGGKTRIIENGGVIEKGGVNISSVHGPLPESMQEYFKVENVDFYACGLSLVIHPNNPMAPTVHANWRYFEMYDKNGKIIDRWFGGGLDLTPYYFFKEDAEHFHKTCKDVCDQFNPEYYNKFKQECDSYFFNKHRNEARGIGGLFFDYLKKDKKNSLEDHYEFIISVSKSFLTAYIPILKKRMNLIYTDEQKNWQEIRRGRYVEFNLVHDKGTIFGLRTNGRIESILMSLPPKVQWKYDFKPNKGSAEEKLLKILKSPRNWI